MINKLLKRIKMYVMINSIEEDIIYNYLQFLTLDDIPSNLKSEISSKKAINSFEDFLRALDLQQYIEIFNYNILKLEATSSEKKFVNSTLSEIIGIRNKIMHPRLLDFYDFPKLQECFNCISKELSLFSWTNVDFAQNNILPNNDELLKLESKIRLKKSLSVIENLPQDVDFEETSFIGRKKEIGEIKEKLFKKNVHILSIVGEGGIGKTSTTIKLLYELLDDINQPFNLILWTSLKTKTLNKYEFQKIENAITDTSGMYKELYDVVGGNDQQVDIKEYLISLSTKFNILLVLDNLETINSEEVKDFLSRFTENAKVIITSRIGLGEMETRYKLLGLKEEDMLEYFDTLLELYGFKNYFTYDEKLNYAKNELHSNPLAIKWFVRTLSSRKDAKDIKDILSHKDDVVNFCMSNVYEKLSEDAKNLLNVLSVLNKSLTIGELFYFMEVEKGNELKIRKAINDLINSSFIEQTIYNDDSVISVSEFAKEFLLKLDKYDQIRLNNKQKRLFAFEQELASDFNTDPYNIKNYFVSTSEKHKLVSAYYLREALSCYKNKNISECSNLLDIAKRISPNFFACNIVSAFLNSSTNPQRSIEEYEIALNNSTDINETRMIYIHYAKFLLSTNDYNGAIDKLDKAELIKKDEYIVFEKTKILSCCGRFDEAYNCIDSIEFHNIEKNRTARNLFYLRLSDIKRREAEKIDNRNISLKLEKLSECLTTVEKEPDPDEDTLNFIALVLTDMFYVVPNKKVLEIINETFRKYNTNLFKTTNFKRLKKIIREKKSEFPNFNGREELLSYVFDVDSELASLNKGEAIIYNVREDFGFVKNLDYPKGIYFSRFRLDFTPKIGDIIKLGKIIEKKQGFAVEHIEYVSNISKRNNI